MIPMNPGETDAPQMTLEAPLTPGAESKPDASGHPGAGGEPVDAEGLLGLDAAPKKSIPFSTILIAAVVLVAGGMLYGMRQIGLGPRVTLAKDLPSVKLPDSRASRVDHQRLLEDLNSARTTQQVPSGQVKKNPFQLLGMALIPATAYTGEEESLRAIREQRERTAKEKAEYAKSVADEVKKLELNAVLGGSQPVARINGSLYRLGDKVGKFHTLKAINSLKRSVDLECDGQIVTLTIPLQGSN